MKRRSNVNKDIKALGLSTVFSGFLGGLNVVAVIAPSSVNISNGGSNRFSNFSHALFLTHYEGKLNVPNSWQQISHKTNGFVFVFYYW